MSSVNSSEPAVSSRVPATQNQLEQFDAAWRHGKAPQLEAYLPPTGTPGRRHMLEELVKIDLEYRWRHARQRPTGLGGPVADEANDRSLCLEDYVLRFPELRPLESLPLDLIGEEYRVRQCWGDRPGPADYMARFAGQGTALQQLLADIDIELAAEPSRFGRIVRGEPGLARSSRHTDPLPHGAAGVFGLPPVNVPGEPAATAAPRRMLPGYEILEEVGRGGMGVVYKAWQNSPHRIVALKMIRSGALAGQEELARFRREAEVVAQLHHPHIVQIYQVGEHDGQPFFALEFLDGGGLDKKLRGIPQPPRLAAQLVEVLARTMQAAHQRGIVHRDLKPANILLQLADGEKRNDNGERDTQPPSAFCNLQSAILKITDFGLAKHLDTGTGATQSGAVLGTPSYMAPEQAEGKIKEITAAADIYALGAILFEMLTGRPPFLGATPLETLMQVRFKDPVPPRQLQSMVPRDLETICLKCLHKDPAKRYPSADSLADDLRRFLQGVPIWARQVSSVERLWHWCRRQPAVASLAGLLTLVMASGIPILIGLWLRAAAHAERAENEFRRAEENLLEARRAVIKHFTIFSEMELSAEPGTHAVQKRLLEAALEYFQQFLRQHADDPDLQSELAAAHCRVALVTSQIGSTEKAIEEFQHARDLLEPLVRVEQPDPELQTDLARCCYCLGRLQADNGHYEEGMHNLEGARTTLKQLLQSRPDDPQVLHDQGLCLIRLGTLHSEGGRPAEARECLEESIRLLEKVVRSSPEHTAAPQDLASACQFLGRVHETSGPPASALPLYERAVQLQEESVKANPNNPDCLSNLAQHLTVLGNLHSRLGQPQRGFPFVERAIDVAERAARNSPGVLDYQIKLADAYATSGNLHATSGEPAKAIGADEQARMIFEKLVHDNPTETWLQSRLAAMLGYLSNMQLKTGATNEALRNAEKAGVSWRSSAAITPRWRCTAATWPPTTGDLQSSKRRNSRPGHSPWSIRPWPSMTRSWPAFQVIWNYSAYEARPCRPRRRSWPCLASAKKRSRPASAPLKRKGSHWTERRRRFTTAAFSAITTASWLAFSAKAASRAKPPPASCAFASSGRPNLNGLSSWQVIWPSVLPK